MNKGQNVRRGRTRHTPNKGGGSSNNGTGNRVDSKSRGNPQQNLDKYLGMARDALQAGDRVNEEYYLQFAEHFQRVINDRAQDDGNRKDRSRNNNNRNRNQSRSSNNMKGENQKSMDPAAQDQPKIADGNTDKSISDKQAEKPKQDAAPLDDKAKPRVARKRSPRVKADEDNKPALPEKASEKAPETVPETVPETAKVDALSAGDTKAAE